MKKILILVTALFLICTAAACADTLTLPASLTVIEEEAFFGNTSLDEVVLPEGLTEIRADAFAGSSLSSINLPSTLTSIADGALPAPGTVTVTATEGSWAYKWALENGYIDVQSGIPINKTLFPDAGFRMFVQQAFDIDKNCILSDEETSAVKMIALTNEEVPVRSLDGVGCFTALEEIHISDGHELSSLDLSQNTKLISLDCAGCGLAALDVSHNTNLQHLDCSDNELTTLELRQNTKLDYLDCGSNRLKELDISRCSVFASNTDNLFVDSEVDVTYASGFCGNGVEFSVINNTCFITGNGKMNDPTDRYKMPWYIYYGTKQHITERITEVVIESGVTSVGAYMFSICKNLETVSFPDDLTRIGKEAFKGCEKLTNVVLPEGLEYIGESAFYGCSNLAEELTIPCGSYGRWCFSECTSLQKVTIAEGATAIAEGMFSECTNLENVDIPSTITVIEKTAFASCKNLINVEIPSGVTGFGWSAFGGSGITSLVIPDGVTGISGWMFNGCESLRFIVIPTSVTYIGERAFCECDNLRYVYYAGSPEQWNEIEIEDDWDGHMPGWNGFHSDYDSYNQPLYNATIIYYNTNDYIIDDYSEDHFATTFTSGSDNIGEATVVLKKGFDFLHKPSSLPNYDLALTAVTLSAQAYDKAQGKATMLLAKLGYEDVFVPRNNSSVMLPKVYYGYKQIANGKNLFAMVVRGTDEDIDKLTDAEDWPSMFSNTAGLIELELENYMQSVTGKTKAELQQDENYFFFTGHSLGGAVANILSIKEEIMEYAASNKNRIYTYTFESPHTCENLGWTDTEAKSNALNYKVVGDAVTDLPNYWWSTTYGTDKMIKVSDLDDRVFAMLFPDSICETLADATSVEGHGDPFGLHDICLDLIYIIQGRE